MGVWWLAVPLFRAVSATRMASHCWRGTAAGAGGETSQARPSATLGVVVGLRLDGGSMQKALANIGNAQDNTFYCISAC